jgi:trehalose utilization protein
VKKLWKFNSNVIQKIGFMVNVVIWNEFVHEQEDEHVKSIYPKGIHGCIKEFLSDDEDLHIKTATLEEKDHGLTEELLDKTDVLIWWGHKAHKLVEDRIVDRVQQRVLEGMGLLVLHSGHHSKIFKRMMGTTANLRWAERGEKERVWVCNPGHPIAEGLEEYFEIEMTEMYGEPFQVPAPDETVFVSWFEGGEVFRSGLCYKRGNGKIFYFRPGHESYPVYYNKDVQRVIKNSVHWVSPEKTAGLWIDRVARGIDNGKRKSPIEPIKTKGHKVDHNYKK